MKKEDKGTIKALAEFIETFPDLKLFEGLFPKIETDVLDENANSYMVEAVPAEPWIKRYLDGSGIKQVVFALSSREYYEDCENVDTNAFYESFSDWLEECTKKGIFPDLGQDKEVLELKATTPGYLYDAQEQKAKYRIQCRLKYYQKAK